MKMALCFFFTFFVSAFQAQTVRAYTDYDACLTGFVTREGDTVVPARYTSVQHVSADYHPLNVKDSLGPNNIWIVEEGGRFAVLNDLGKEIMPAIFDDFMYRTGKLLTMQKNGKWGAVYFNGDPLIPFEYSGIYQKEYDDNRFILKKGAYEGLYDFDQQQFVIPVGNITKIERESDWMESYLMDDSTGMYIAHLFRYYHTWSGEKVGVYDYYGYEILPPEFDHAEPLILNTKCNDTVRFFVGTDNGLPTIYDYQGNALKTLPNKLRVQHLPHEEDCGDKILFEVLEKARKKKPNRYQLVDFETGKTSEPFIERERFDDFFILNHGKSYSIVDFDLNTVLPKQNIPLRTTFDGRGGYYGFDLETFIVGFPDNLVHTADSVVFTVVQEDYNSYFGLLNYHTGATIENKYDLFSFVLDSVNKQRYFWAFDWSKEGITLDIYNTSMELLKHYDRLSFVDDTNLEELALFRFVPPFFENQDEKVGGFLPNGELLLPFEYEYVASSLDEYDIEMGEPGNILYHLRHLEDSTSLVFKNNAGLILEGYFDEVSWLSNGPLIYSSYNGLYQFYDSIGNSLIGDVQYFSPKYFGNMETSVLYVVKGNQSFRFQGGNLESFDPSSIADSEKHYLPKDIIWSDSGTVISYGNLNHYRVGEIYNVYDYQNKHSTLLDPSGNVLLEHNDKIDVREDQNGYWIEFTKGYRHMSGILSKDLETWLIAPEYEEIQRFRMKDRFVYQCKKIGWQLFSDNFEPLFDFSFDHWVGFDRDGYAYVSRGGKYGLLDQQLNVVIPMEYDQIITYKGGFLVKKDSLWGVRSYDSLIVPTIFTDLNTYFPETLIATTNDSIYHLQPYTFEYTGRYHKDSLRAALFHKRDRFTGGHVRILLDEGKSFGEIREELLTYYILEVFPKTMISQGDRYETLRKIPEFRPSKRSFPDKYTYNNGFFIEIKCIGAHYTKVRKSIHQVTINESKKKPFETGESVYQTLYHENGITQPLQLKHLFKNHEVPAFLRNELKRKMQVQQSFGLACADLDTAVDDALRYFDINENGIYFTYIESKEKRHQFLLYYKDLKPYLLHPKAFL